MKNLLAIWTLCVIISPQITNAQKGTVELGLDATIDYQITDNFDSEFISFENPDVVMLSIPVMGVRFGIFATETVSIEPVLAVQVASSDGDTYTIMDAQLGLLYHLKADPEKARPYLRAAPVVSYVSFSDDSASQFGISGKVGVKVPIARALTANFAAGVQRDFENDDFAGGTTISGTFGFSFFVNR